MQNFDKIFPPLTVVSGNLPKSFKKVKDLFWQALPPAFKMVSAGLILLIFQVILVGSSDRLLGISPKLSLIFSSLLFALIFGGLAIIGGLKLKTAAEVSENNLIAKPICKLLIIRRKDRR